ncbi:MAG: RNB domain-containing ribonuclease [Lentisphaeria bacterium]|nr:RNB domain-containing ribonuclease [Lentisphaeria bacterium]
MLIKTNSLVIYKGKCAIVKDVAADKYSIRTSSGDTRSVRIKDIEFLHAGPCQTIPATPVLPDDELLAETAELLGNDEITFAEFTELLFSGSTPENALGAWEILQKDCYFAGSPSTMIKAHSAEHTANILSKARLKAEQQEARNALLARIRSGNIADSDRSSLREIENVAYGESTSSKLMHDLNMEALPEKAQSLLLKLNVWNDFDNNPHIRRCGMDLHPEYPELLPPPAEERVDLTHLSSYAIDDAESNDPDDAIAYDSANDLLWVHVADPAAAVEFDSDLEKFACSQGCTSYLPEKITTMLPENSVEMFALGLQEKSPAMSFGIKIHADGKAVLEKICLSHVRVKRMDYAQGDELMQTAEFAPCVQALERFRQYRQNNNAVMIRLPEVKIKVDIQDRKINITPHTPSPVRELVANAMMAAGHAVAEFSIKNDFALPYAIQSDPEMSERPDTLPGMYELRKSCRISTLSTVPGKHAGLGLEPYARVTSPLRRYEDLLSHIQLRRFLAGKAPLTASVMDERIATAEPAAVLRTKLERQCREYWTLVYLKNQPADWQTEAVYIAKPDERSVWLLPDLAYEFKNRYNSRMALGEKVMVQCIASDPAMLSAQFRVVVGN